MNEARIDNAVVKRFPKSEAIMVEGIEYKGEKVSVAMLTAGTLRMYYWFSKGRQRDAWNTDHITWDELESAAIDAIEYDNDMSGLEEQRNHEAHQAFEEQSEELK